MTSQTHPLQKHGHNCKYIIDILVDMTSHTFVLKVNLPKNMVKPKLSEVAMLEKWQTIEFQFIFFWKKIEISWLQQVA